MPKLKLAKKPKVPNNLIANLNWVMSRQGYKVKDLAELIGIGETTLYRRMIKPEDFTLDELCKISEVAGMDLQTLQFGGVSLSRDDAAG
jgi:DNA-binding Xre family transcriptional regulator